MRELITVIVIICCEISRFQNLTSEACWVLPTHPLNLLVSPDTKTIFTLAKRTVCKQALIVKSREASVSGDSAITMDITDTQHNSMHVQSEKSRSHSFQWYLLPGRPKGHSHWSNDWKLVSHSLSAYFT